MSAGDDLPMTHLSRRNLASGFSSLALLAPFLWMRRSNAAGYAQSSSPEASEQFERAQSLMAAARQQIGITTDYDGRYQALDYPGGDVDRRTGVCVDVIIRAYRDAFDYDLQKHVHEDMKANFAAYPPLWRMTRPDRNIDHRRVPNLETFFRRQRSEIYEDEARAGDMVSMRLPGNLPHIGFLAEAPLASGAPYRLVHNIGRGTREERLTAQADRFLFFRFLPNLA